MAEKNKDYYINEDGNYVFTEAYHLERGFCCENECLHCPWNYGQDEGQDCNSK